MKTHSNHQSRRKVLQRVALVTLIALLTACGGGGDNPIAVLYTSISISDLSYPADEDTNDDVKIEARASTIGEISGSDIDWSLEQTYGHDFSVTSKDLSDDNHKVIFHVKAPDRSGAIGFRIKAKANGYSDTRTFSVDIK